MFAYSLFYDFDVPTRIAYMLWDAFIFYYLYMEFKRRLKGNPAKRKTVKKNYQFTLFIFGAAALLVYHLTKLGRDRDFYAVFPDPVGLFVGLLAGLPLMLWGFFLVIKSKTALGQYWGLHIYDYGKDAALITAWPYTMVRHPIYLGQTLMASGSFLLGNDWAVFFFPVGTALMSIRRAMVEDDHLQKVHGTDFKAFQSRVPLMFPAVGSKGLGKE